MTNVWAVAWVEAGSELAVADAMRREGWEDQPNVPESYEPAPEDREEYAHGQFMAVLEVQDYP